MASQVQANFKLLWQKMNFKRVLFSAQYVPFDTPSSTITSCRSSGFGGRGIASK